MSASDAIKTVIQKSLTRDLSGKAVGWAFVLASNGIPFVSICEGWARAPWEPSNPSLQITADKRIHGASLAKMFTACAVLIVIDDWKRVINSAAGFMPKVFAPPYLVKINQLGITEINALTAKVAHETGYHKEFVKRVFQNPKGISIDSTAVNLLRKRFPGNFVFGRGVEQVTLRHLLSFTSMFDYANLNVEYREWDDFYNYQDLLEKAFARDLRRVPPGQYPDLYSGEDYGILRVVIEECSAAAWTGIDYENFIKSRVFVPAGIYDVSCKNDATSSDTLYYPSPIMNDTGTSKTGFHHPPSYTNTAGGGGWFGSPNSIVKWLDAVKKSLLLPQYITDQWLNIKEPLGWWWTGTYMEKNGGTNAGTPGGTNCNMAILPNNMTAVLMINTADINASEVFRNAIFSFLPSIISDQEKYITPEISIVNRFGFGETRFTLDGTEPGVLSSQFSLPLFIPVPAVINGAVFDGNEKLTWPSKLFVTFDPEDLRPPDDVSPSAAGTGLNYNYYRGEFEILPNTQRLIPEASGKNALPDISQRPAADTENFAFEYTGYINAPVSGVYIFSIVSDDGSQLWIGNIRVVNNDYMHGDREMKRGIALQAGLHKIRIVFFQRGGGAKLEVKWRTPSAAVDTLLNTSVLYDKL